MVGFQSCILNKEYMAFHLLRTFLIRNIAKYLDFFTILLFLDIFFPSPVFNECLILIRFLYDGSNQDPVFFQGRIRIWVFFSRVGSGQSQPGSPTLRTVHRVAWKCPHGRKVCPYWARPAIVYNAYLGIKGLQMVPCQRIFARISTKEIVLCDV